MNHPLQNKLSNSFVCQCRVLQGGDQLEVIVSTKLYRNRVDYQTVLNEFTAVKDELEKQGVSFVTIGWPSKPTGRGVHNTTGHLTVSLKEWNIRNL